MTIAPVTDKLALAAIEPIRSGMIVGLGTGRAAARAIRALGARLVAEKLSIICVATSEASATLARSLGLDVKPMARTARVDYLFDGADEVDPQHRMIKGRGGAMTRERIVAHAAQRRVYLIDESKLVPHLGMRAPLPIEVLEFALSSVLEQIKSVGLGDTFVRLSTPEHPVRTDEGNMILDAHMPASSDPNAIAAQLDAMSGVIDHGLFLNEADEVIVETPAGDIRRL